MELDLSAIILRFAAPLPRQRRAPSAFSAGGIATPGAVTSDTIVAMVQPLSPRQLSVLKEGLRESAKYSVWTADEVRTVDAAGSQMPDVLVYKGRSYNVHSVEAWEDHGNFRELVMVDATAP